ncbi:MAG: HAMP domain-containing sensor histidine kinase [Candidatus Delongbacteria bacterium]|jgi:signal transduction histidine kinase/heme/copper-type cytochrome/quinol oxidase subunit 4|nr:HAMP domain-containing sensor histidine kinase [Candidatus Delongbacteria bacterium]
MVEKTKSEIIKKNTQSKQYWILFSLFIVLEVIVYFIIINKHTANAINAQKQESKNSVEFLQKIIKANMQNNNYSQIEYFITSWYESHKNHLGDLTLTADNGFILINIHNEQLKFKNTLTITKDIEYLFNKKMRLQLVIDLENSLTNVREYIIIIIIMILFTTLAFAYMIFVTIKKNRIAIDFNNHQEELDNLLDELVQEVERRKSTEDNLVRNHNLLQQAQEIALMGSWEFDFEERNMKVSPEFFSIVKLPFKNNGIISTKELSKVTMNYNKILRESLSTNENIHFDDECFVIDQFTRSITKNIRVIGKSIIDEKTSKKVLRGIIQDISEKKKIENEIESANNDLKEMLHIVAHELQTPLVTMEGFSTLILDNITDDIDETFRYYLQRIKSNALSMKKLINSILDISRLNTIKYPHEKFDTQLMIIKLKEEIEIISGRKVTIVVKTFPEIPKIFGDRQRIYLVFRNLVLNAINYNGINIEIGYKPNKGFYIKDDGIGIKTDYIERIFMPGERLKETEAEGTGMGLTFCKKIMELHHGKIWAESEGKGEGTTFFFSLPIRDDE